MYIVLLLYPFFGKLLFGNVFVYAHVLSARNKTIYFYKMLNV